MARISKFIVEVLVALGSLACILVWLEIKPRDIKMMALPTPGHWPWLLMSLVLVAISLSSSIYSLVRSKKEKVTPGTLIIHSAIYGAKGRYYPAVKLADRIKGNEIDIFAESQYLVDEDPLPNQPPEKTLFVAYSYGQGSLVKYVAVREHQRLVITSSSATGSAEIVADPWQAIEELHRRDTEVRELRAEKDRLAAQDSQHQFNFQCESKRSEALAAEVAELKQAIGPLQAAAESKDGTINALTFSNKQKAWRVRWLEFKYVLTPDIGARLNRKPIVKIQHYSGELNAALAIKIANFFIEMEWQIKEGEHKGSKVTENNITNLKNSQAGKRILLTYADIATFHEATQSLENSDFFEPEMITRSTDKSGQAEYDLLVTIFPKNHWD